MTDVRPNPGGYTPIACDRYSELELAIMKGQLLRMRWTAGNVTHDAAVLPLDLQTRAGEEFLICRHGMETLELRLDQIRRWEAA